MTTMFPTYKRAAVADLIPYARNSRTHSDAQVAQIAASIREFGFTNPVLVDAYGGIIAGHGRVMAARKLGRWQQFTGKSATLEGDGRTFDEVAAQRIVKAET